MEEGKKTIQWTVFPATALMENRNGLITDCDLTKASGAAGREAALVMIKRGRETASRAVRMSRVTLGAGKGFDAEDFVLALKGRNVTPHIAINARTYAAATDHADQPACSINQNSRRNRSI